MFCASCSDAPSDADCQKLLNHFIDIEMNESGSGGLSTELAKESAEAKKRVAKHIREDFMASCAKNLPASRVACGLKARTAAQLAACDES